jgi:isopentenyldiphosphate isomerase
VQAYIAFINSDYPLVKQDSEVEALKWFPKKELFELLDEKPEIFLPSIRESATNFFNYENQS